MANSLLAYSDTEGPVKGYKYPLSDDAKAEIEKEEEEEETGFNPLHAAALSAGASLLRNSGWSRNPMSLGESIGHAIPHGMQAYYNQDALNQNEQAALYERQQAEQTVLDAKQKAEDDIKIQEQDQESFSQMMNELGLSVTEQKTMLRFYMKNPKEASAYLAKQIMDKGKTTEKTKMLTLAEIKLEGLDEGQMYQRKPDGTISVLPSPKKDGTWKFMTKTQKKDEGLPIDQVWQISEGGEIKRAKFEDAPKKKDTFRENISKLQPNGKYQMRKILFSADGKTEIDLGPSELQAAPPKDETYDYFNKTDFLAHPKLKNLNWPVEAHAAAVDGSGELKGFYTAENAFIPTGTKGIELEQAQDRIDIAQNTLELKETDFQQQQDNYESDKTQEMLQRAKDNKWTQEKLNREKYAHTAKMSQMAKNYEDRTQYISAEEFLEDNETARLPKGVAFLEVTDGKVTKMVEKDFSTWVEPLNSDADDEIGKELKKLYADHEFTQEQKDIIRGLRIDKDDPMAALKQAHDYMQKEGKKLIQAPASILKKYQSDMGVRRAAEEALAMINDPKQMAIIEKEVGFFYGQVTEKAKHPLFQKFKAIATMANLTKRHELIGSQMTDGELKFTEPLFVSDKDTATSLKVKLQTLLTDANFNLGLTRNMFSKGAGYNDAVWGDDATKWWNEDGTRKAGSEDDPTPSGAGPYNKETIMKKPVRISNG